MHVELHPVFVHFPIAMIVICLLLDWGRWIFDRDRLLGAGFWGGSTPLLVIALLGAIGAVTTGLIAEPGDDATPIVKQLVETHQTLAFITSGLLALLVFWRLGLRGRFPQRLQFLYLVLLLVLATVVGYGAYFGGQMVFTHGVGVSPAFR